MKIKGEPSNIRRRVHRPAGYRILGEPVGQTEKAIQFCYYNWIIWLPKFAVIHLRDDSFCAPIWAIDSGKEHESALHGESVDEFLYQRELRE